MKSGLEGRNNPAVSGHADVQPGRLNEVRPRRPEQFAQIFFGRATSSIVSMKSGLDGRNNVDAIADFHRDLQSQ